MDEFSEQIRSGAFLPLGVNDPIPGQFGSNHNSSGVDHGEPECGEQNTSSDVTTQETQVMEPENQQNEAATSNNTDAQEPMSESNSRANRPTIVIISNNTDAQEPMSESNSRAKRANVLNRSVLKRVCRNCKEGAGPSSACLVFKNSRYGSANVPCTNSRCSVCTLGRGRRSSQPYCSKRVKRPQSKRMSTKQRTSTRGSSKRQKKGKSGSVPTKKAKSSNAACSHNKKIDLRLEISGNLYKISNRPLNFQKIVSSTSASRLKPKAASTSVRGTRIKAKGRKLPLSKRQAPKAKRSNIAKKTVKTGRPSKRFTD